MDRNTLVAELLGHGNHMVVTESTRPEDMAKSMGLMLLALGELLEPGVQQKSTSGIHKMASPGAMSRMTAGTKPASYVPKVSSRF
jgi:hypothetical protein